MSILKELRELKEQKETIKLGTLGSEMDYYDPDLEKKIRKRKEAKKEFKKTRYKESELEGQEIEYYDPNLEEKVAQWEGGSEPSLIGATMAGVASGGIKIGEGIVSLGAELIDLGVGTDMASNVEMFFDRINPFEKIAQKRLSGRIAEILTQVGIPGGLGFKIGSKMATRAIRAKRKGEYINFRKSVASRGAAKPVLVKESFRKELRNRSPLKKIKESSLTWGMIGSGAGEALVADESIGTFGDLWGGTTAMTRSDDAIYGDNPPEGREDAFRRLLNRVKFGTEGALFTGVIAGIGRGAKALAKRSDDMAYDEVPYVRALQRLYAGVSPAGRKSIKQFDLQRKRLGKERRDISEAEIMNEGARREAQEFYTEWIRSADGSFEWLSKKFSGLDNSQLGEIWKLSNAVLKSGRIEERRYLGRKGALIFDGNKVQALNNLIENFGANPKSFMKLIKNQRRMIDNFLTKITDRLQSARGTRPLRMSQDSFNELIDSLTKARGNYLNSSFDIFKSPGFILSKYKPTQEAKEKMIKLLQRHARMKTKGTFKLTDMEANDIVLNMIKQVEKMPGVGGLTADKAVWNLSKLSQAANYDKSLNEIFERLYANMAGKAKEIKRGDEVVKTYSPQTKARVSKAFKEIYGTVEDSRQNFLDTTVQLSTWLRRDEFYQDIANESLRAVKNGTRPIVAGLEFAGTGLDKAAMATAAKNAALKHFPNVKPDDIVPLNFSKEMSPITNPLEGGWAPKWIRDSLIETNYNTFLNDTIAGKAYKLALLYPKSVAFISKTVLGPFTHGRNFISAAAFALANGIIPLPATPVLARRMKDAFGTAFQKGSGNKANDDMYHELLELGVVNTNTRIGDLMKLLDETKMGEDFTKYVTGKSVANKFRSMYKWAQDLYVAEDDFWKIFNYANELGRLKDAYLKAGVKMSDDMVKTLKQRAARVVRNTVPNYDYVGDMVKALRFTPFGNFMSFPSEIIRTSVNIVDQAFKEMANPITRSIGVKRGLGFLFTVPTLSAAAVEGGKALYDVSEDKIKAMRRYVPVWSKYSTIVPAGYDKDGNYKYIDWSHSNAYDVAMRPLRSIGVEMANTDFNTPEMRAGFLKGVIAGTAELAQPFISESIFVEAMSDLLMRGGKTREGTQVFNPEDGLGDRVWKITKHIGKSVAPGNYQQMERMWTAAHGEPNKNNIFYDFKDEIPGVFGYRVQVIRPEHALGFKINDFQYRSRSAKKIFNSVALRGYSSADELVQAYKKANRALFDVQKDFRQDILAGLELNLSKKSLRKEMGKRIGGDQYGFSMRGRFLPYFPSADVIAETREKAREVGKPVQIFKALKAIRRIYRKNIRKSLMEDDFNDLSSELSMSQPMDFEATQTGVLTTAGLPESMVPFPPLNQATAMNTPGGNLSGLQSNAMNTGQVNQMTGLTRTQEALLSPDEKLIAQRQNQRKRMTGTV